MSRYPSSINRLPQYYHFEQADHMDKPLEVDVEGEIPAWLNGSLYRNGAGVFKVGDTAWNHAFDGFAVVQRWMIWQGHVTYQSSILDCEDYIKCAKFGKIVGEGLGTRFPDPCETIFGRLFNRFVPGPPYKTDNTNVNILEFGDRLFALTECPIVNEIHPDSLAVKGKSELSDYVAVHVSTAHPHKLPDGTVIYFGTNMNYTKAYNFIAIPPQKDPSISPFAGAKIIATAASRWRMNISYTHTFGITENYFVQLEQPLTISLPRAMLCKPLGMNGADFLVSHEGESLDIMLISRTTGQRLPVTYRAPEGVVFHFINCYEDLDHVVCDICYFPRGTNSIHRLYFDMLLEDRQARVSNKFGFTRFVLPLTVEGVGEGMNLVTLPGTTATAFLATDSKNVVCVFPEIFDENLHVELPSINNDYDGIKYRYCYASTTIFNLDESKLVKYDLVEKTLKSYVVSVDHTPGEPVFVPRPGATREDDGVVLATIVANNSRVQSYLVVLDATTFQEMARASLPTEMKMVFTFHGIFTDKTFSR